MVTRVAPVDPACNCHGWVFTGGRFWVSGEDVPRILEDNGYRRVSVQVNYPFKTLIKWPFLPGYNNPLNLKRTVVMRMIR